MATLIGLYFITAAKVVATFNGYAQLKWSHLILSRVVGGELQLLDGDKIAALACVHLRHLLEQADLLSLTMGVIQTAYANGSSTRFFEQRVCFAATSMPALHPNRFLECHGLVHQDGGPSFAP